MDATPSTDTGICLVRKTKTHFGILAQMLATNRTVMQVQSKTSP
jgi:hypothetical protein